MYKYLWKRCLDEEVIKKAWKKLRKGKTERDDVIRIDGNLDYYVKKMQEQLRNTRPGEVEHPELAFCPPPHIPHTVFEHGKERTIFCPSIWEQWVHHIIVQVLGPIIIKHSYKYSCGSMPKRGSHYGKRKMERIIKKGFRNFAKLDIRHFFNSIRIDVVIVSLSKIIDDDWFLYLIRLCFKHFQKGLPLGFYLSQWLANFILHEMDEAIIREDPDGFIRYMDDMTIADNSKKKLWKIIAIIRIELGKLRLKLKGNYAVAKFEYTKKNGKTIGRPVDFMGFVFHRNKTLLRKKILIRTTRFARRLSKVTHISRGQAQSMTSRAGWFRYTNTYNVWLEYIKPYVNIKALKKIISKWQRRKSNVRVEKRVVLGAT